MIKRIALFLLISPFWFSQVATAQGSLDNSFCQPSLEAELLDQEAEDLAALNVVTADTISQEQISVPSLWWAKEQFARKKLLINWIAHQEESRIDLIVNRQLWSNLSDIERYAFVNKFGNVARRYKYNLRVFNQQQRCLAAYTCQFNPAGESRDDCKIQFNLIQGGLQL